MKGIKKIIFGNIGQTLGDVPNFEAFDITDVDFDYTTLQKEPNIILLVNNNVSFDYRVYKKYNF